MFEIEVKRAINANIDKVFDLISSLQTIKTLELLSHLKCLNKAKYRIMALERLENTTKLRRYSKGRITTPIIGFLFDKIMQKERY